MKRAAAALAAAAAPLSAIAVAVVLMSLPSGCGSGRVSEPLLLGELTLTEPLVERGRREFMARCHQCHPGGAAGLAPAINDKPLPAWLIRFQVRNGLGAMPAFSEAELSDEALDAIVAYLDTMHDLAESVDPDERAAATNADGAEP